ncbi:isoprenylcysteine carboxylmethyltransferase family protein [Microbulbifer sp. Q7]|uniref:methyltransferase family protein n=1 Tax=Microbulbifer sp. Q7 TaxID=1785091 RepID=UPI0012903393|nr:isoprenylcysteine carboxylmethyltransferase family protein [Microbulbifer sp. Q7]
MERLELKIPPIVQVLFFAGFMWVLAGLLPILSITFAASSLAAIVFASAGLIFILLGVLAFRSAGTTVDPRVPDQSTCLVTSGVYRISRNPMYAGFLLMLVGWAVFLSNIASILLLPLFVMYMNPFQITPEEQCMREKFGGEYREYESAVLRWI